VSDRYEPFDDPYVYKNTDVLKNKAGLRDAGLLEAFELEMTALRADEPLPPGRYGAVHYRAVHRHLFQDVFRWAGRYRTIRTAKGGAVFCYPEHIPAAMDDLFTRLKVAPFVAGAAFDDLPSRRRNSTRDLNAIHPFREGNGRVQLTFLHMIAARAGHPLDMLRVRQATIIPAMVASFYGDLALLIAEIRTLRA
jgi:cell filamentation protein